MEKLIFLIVMVFNFPYSYGNPMEQPVEDSQGIGTNSYISNTIMTPIFIDFKGGATFNWNWWGFDPQGALTPPISWGVTYSMYPVLVGGGEKTQYFISLANLNQNDDISFVSENDPYLVVENKDFQVGGYFSAGPTFPMTFAVSGSLMPQIGSRVYSERFAPNLESARNLPRISFSQPEQIVLSLKENDFLTYNIRGGITFGITGSFLGLAGNFSVTAMGTWEVALKKSKDQKVFVRVSSIKLKNLYAGAGLNDTAFSAASLGGGGIFAKINTNVFEFDLSKPEAVAALNDLFKGNINLKEELPSGMRHLLKEQDKTRGRYWDAQAMLPYIAAVEHRQSHSFTQAELIPLQNDLDVKKVETKLGVFSEIISTYGPLTRHLNKVRIFAVSKQTSRDKNDYLREGYTASLKMAYQREKVRDYNWNKEIKEMAKLLGKVDGELLFDLPGKNLGFLRMQVDLRFPDSTIRGILEKLENLNGQIDGYLWNKLVFEVAKDQCRDTRTQMGGKICIKYWTKSHSKSTKKKLEKQFAKILASWRLEDKTNFIKDFEKLGQFLSEDPLSLQYFFILSGKGNYCLDFSAQGEKIEPVSKSLETGLVCKMNL